MNIFFTDSIPLVCVVLTEDAQCKSNVNMFEQFNASLKSGVLQLVFIIGHIIITVALREPVITVKPHR